MSSFSMDFSCMAPRFSLSPRRVRLSGDGESDSDSDSDAGQWTVRRRPRGVTRKGSLRKDPQPAPKEQPKERTWAPLPPALAGKGQTIHYNPVGAPMPGPPGRPPPAAKGAKVTPGEAARRVVAKLAARDAAKKGPLVTPTTDSEDCDGWCTATSESASSCLWTARSSAFTPVIVKDKGSEQVVDKAPLETEGEKAEHPSSPAPRSSAASLMYSLGEDVHAVLALLM
eukprot:TRINITY_DN1358_c0_g3_i1.p2 TRINITY_DN1358_c0_g3~~TRINITY_DN1358_c0_g3_i1.p2  ORF type:complete len:227 (+),score=65.08 TRINITY_DN1358_c0_g3_i1:77-757(+)